MCQFFQSMVWLWFLWRGWNRFTDILKKAQRHQAEMNWDKSKHRADVTVVLVWRSNQDLNKSSSDDLQMHHQQRHPFYYMFDVLWIRIVVPGATPQSFELYIRTISSQYTLPSLLYLIFGKRGWWKCGWWAHCSVLITLYMHHFLHYISMNIFKNTLLSWDFTVWDFFKDFKPYCAMHSDFAKCESGLFYIIKMWGFFFSVKAQMFYVWPEHGRLFIYNKIQTANDIRALFMLSWQQGWISKSWAPGQEPSQGPPFISLQMNQCRDSLSPHSTLSC